MRRPSARILTLALLFGAAVVSGEEPPGVLMTWGEEGSGDGEFNYVFHLAFDADGVVYVADSANNRIQKFTASGTYLGQWGSLGTANGEFHSPRGVAVDPSGSFVYVTEGGNHRVQKFTTDGVHYRTWGSEGTAAGQFLYPCGIAVDAIGNVYVTDPGNDRIQKFDPEGNFLRMWGGPGSSDGQFADPLDVAVDVDGKVYVADTNHHRIQVFTGTGDYLGQWGSYGSDPGQLSGPYAVEVDGGGYVFVADYGNHRVQKFSTDGAYQTHWGVYGSAEGEFKNPVEVVPAPNGDIYVSDQQNDRIQRFTYAQPFECVGFEFPLDAGPVTVRGRNRVLPLTAELFDVFGVEITPADLPAPPVVQVWYDPGLGGDPIDVTDDVLTTGAASEGNEFEYLDTGTDAGKWFFGLKTTNYTAAGSYTMLMDRGSPEYRILPTCSATFVRE